MKKLEFTDDCPREHRMPILIHQISEIIKGWERAEGVEIVHYWHSDAGGYVQYWKLPRKHQEGLETEGENGRLHHLFDDLMEFSKNHGLDINLIHKQDDGGLSFWLNMTPEGGHKYYLLGPKEAVTGEENPHLDIITHSDYRKG